VAVIHLSGAGELDRATVGGKAWGINHMRSLGMPVPAAFVVTTDECLRHLERDDLDPALAERIRAAVGELAAEVGRGFGAASRPLLVSVRSGAAQSMPGMMDSVLNLGLTSTTAAALAQESGDAAFAADLARRFDEQFTRIVGAPPADDAWDQLEAAVRAVFSSWTSARARAYRAHHGIPETGGTSVTVQAMVFGNLGADSGTGVLFTRDPRTGASAPFGQWLPGGQGEDVVSGRFDALPLSELAAAQPAVHAQLLEAAARLEAHARDVQDIEYTVQEGRLHLLQTRNAKRSPDAAIRLAVAMCTDGLITTEQAVARISATQIEIVCRPRIDPAARAAATLLATGDPASPGVGRGMVALSCEEAETLDDNGTEAVLVRPTTDPDDVPGMILATAVVTEVGGATSHAAVVSRELGTPCVVGCGLGTTEALKGRNVTVDGTTGEIFDGLLDVAPSAVDSPDLATLTDWARRHGGVGTTPAQVFRSLAG
jgi:pyruvate,orthophosphate dikinase